MHLVPSNSYFIQSPNSYPLGNYNLRQKRDRLLSSDAEDRTETSIYTLTMSYLQNIIRVK